MKIEMIRVALMSHLRGGMVGRPRGKLSRTYELAELQHTTLLSASTIPGLPTIRVMSVVMLIEDSTLPGFIEVETQSNYNKVF